MSTTPQSLQLRARADSLRNLSAKIGKSLALTVYSGAGPDPGSLLRGAEDDQGPAPEATVDTARQCNRAGETGQGDRESGSNPDPWSGLMGLLAYDPARLEVLRTAASKALDDVRGIRCDDPEAAAAMIAVRSACRTLNEFCLPRIQDIFNSDAMTSYHRLKLDKNDIRQALVFTMAVAYKWRISSDPFEDDTTIVTTAEARALGA